MITDKETNLLYLSGQLISRKTFFESLKGILNRREIEFRILPYTNDIWTVDYMPVQKDIDRFIQFRYEPDYLQEDEYILEQTDIIAVCKAININIRESEIKIDGGNVIRGKNWVILTDKIFKENQNINSKDLVSELERVFEAKPIIIPQEPYDYTGHADGILRHYDNETVLINCYRPADKRDFQKKLKTTLFNEGLKTIEIPYAPYDNDDYDKADGLYINFLQMENFILFPTFDKKEDEQALRQFEQLFPGQIIETIDSREISKEGGVLNCITWNIKVDQNWG